MEDVTEPWVAEIVDVPWPDVVTRPKLPIELLGTATLALDELHVTVDVMSCFVLSVYVPVAVNC